MKFHLMQTGWQPHCEEARAGYILSNTCRGRLFLNLAVRRRHRSHATPFLAPPAISCYSTTSSSVNLLLSATLICFPVCSFIARPSIGQMVQAFSASRLHLSAIFSPPIRWLWQVPSRPSIGAQGCQARQGKRPADWSQMRNDHREAPLSYPEIF